MKKLLNYIWISLFMLSGCAKAYDRGYQGFKWDFVFNKWHPFTWLLYIIALIPSAIIGEKITYMVPIKLGKFYYEKDLKNELIWGTWWQVMKDISYYYNVYQPYQKKLRNKK